jgi:hypothetical protein
VGKALLEYVAGYQERAGLLGDRYPDIVTTGTGVGRPDEGDPGVEEGDGDPTPDPQEA